MNYLKSLAYNILLGIACATLTSSCAIYPPPQDLNVHGKCGGCAAIGSWLIGAPVNIVLLPVVIPIVNLSVKKHEFDREICYFTPVNGISLSFYYLVAGITYPAYLCVLPFEGMPSDLSDEEKTAWLVKELPYLDRSDYEMLVRLSKRDNAPAYNDFGGGDELKYRPPFGCKPKVKYELSADWKRWLKAKADNSVSGSSSR